MRLYNTCIYANYNETNALTKKVGILYVYAHYEHQQKYNYVYLCKCNVKTNAIGLFT